MDKNNIAFDTMNMLDMFDDEDSTYKPNGVVLNIPHSSTNIPILDGYVVSTDEVMNEVNLLTDHATHEIFNLKDCDSVIANFSRVFCDVERLPDHLEPMFVVGRGFYYSKKDNGKPLRYINGELKNHIHKHYYTKYHNKLNSLVNSKLKINDKVLLIDCHSFANKPFDSDFNKNTNRPDFCIGTDLFHTPMVLQNKICNYLKSLGYSVKLNNPYGGTIVPLEHYKNNSNLHSVMIEVNRDLYMENDLVINDKVIKLNKILNNLIKILT